MSNINFAPDDFRTYLAFQEFKRIADSDIRSALNEHMLRYGLSFDAKRLETAVVKMAEVQADLDSGLL